MMLLADLTAQKMSDPFSGQEVLIDGPIQRRSIFPIEPILSHASGKDRMLDVEEKDSIFLQCPMYFLKNGVQVLDIVQSQIGNHAVPCGLRILIFLDPTHLVEDPFPTVAPFGFLNHFWA